MNGSLKAAVLGSIVVLVLASACGTDTPASVTAASQTPTSDAPPTASPSPSATVRTHVLSEATDDAVGVTVTVPTGWSGDPGGWAMEWGPDGFDQPAGAGIIAFVVDEEFYVYGDPCDWKRTRPETPATTVDEIVDALANQASRDASAPEEITVGGYAAKKITLHVPDDVRFTDCDQGNFAAFGVAGEDPALYAQGEGEIDEIWIVDVDGRIVVLEGGYWAATPPDVVDELHEILRSATFE